MVEVDLMRQVMQNYLEADNLDFQIFLARFQQALRAELLEFENRGPLSRRFG